MLSRLAHSVGSPGSDRVLLLFSVDADERLEAEVVEAVRAVRLAEAGGHVDEVVADEDGEQGVGHHLVGREAFDVDAQVLSLVRADVVAGIEARVAPAPMGRRVPQSLLARADRDIAVDLHRDEDGAEVEGLVDLVPQHDQPVRGPEAHVATATEGREDVAIERDLRRAGGNHAPTTRQGDVREGRDHHPTSDVEELFRLLVEHLGRVDDLLVLRRDHDRDLDHRGRLFRHDDRRPEVDLGDLRGGAGGQGQHGHRQESHRIVLRQIPQNTSQPNCWYSTLWNRYTLAG